MAVFADLCVPAQGPESLLARAATLHRLGYRTVAVDHQITGRFPTALGFPILAPIAVPAGTSSADRVAVGQLQQLSRVTVLPEDGKAAHALTAGSDVLRPFDIVAVRPSTEKVFSQACNTFAVDIISIDFSERLPFYLKTGPLGVAISRGIHFEICYTAALHDSVARRNLLNNALALVKMTKGRNIVVSSEAQRAIDARSPHDVVNVCRLFGLPATEAKKALTTTAAAVVAHARMRTSTYRSVLWVQPTQGLPADQAWVLEGIEPEGQADLDVDMATQ